MDLQSLAENRLVLVLTFHPVEDSMRHCQILVSCVKALALPCLVKEIGQVSQIRFLKTTLVTDRQDNINY